MNEAQWDWLTSVLGMKRPPPSGTMPQHDDEDDTPVERLSMADSKSGIAHYDSPIDTAALGTTTAANGPANGANGKAAAVLTPPPSPGQVEASTSGTPEDKKKLQTTLNDIVKRYKAITKPNATFQMVKATKDFFAVYTPCNGFNDSKEYSKGVALLTSLEGAMKALEALAADLPKKQKAATDEAAKVLKMKVADLKKLGAEDKSKLIETLLAGGQPTGDVRKAQIAIYKNATLDPKFLKADSTRGDQIAADLKGDKELKVARKGWKTATEDDKIKALKKIVAAQSKRLGIPPPDVVIEHNPPKDGLVTNGYFDPSDGKLHINMDPASSVQNFQRAVDLAIHENAHNWQASLVKQLKDGKLKKGDINYDQALMFAVNELNPGGYIDGAEDYEAYKKQPLEDHSWTTGPATAKKIMKGI